MSKSDEIGTLVRELREAYLASDRRFCLHADLLARAAAALDASETHAEEPQSMIEGMDESL